MKTFRMFTEDYVDSYALHRTSTGPGINGYVPTADLNASKKSEILKSGATALQHHCKEHTLAHAKQTWGGLLWPYFPELAYRIGTQHPSPDYRSQALLNKSQELENKKDVFVLA